MESNETLHSIATICQAVIHVVIVYMLAKISDRLPKPKRKAPSPLFMSTEQDKDRGLLPCTCGGKAMFCHSQFMKIRTHDHFATLKDNYTVSCVDTECKAIGTTVAPTEEGAIKAWNLRVALLKASGFKA